MKAVSFVEIANDLGVSTDDKRFRTFVVNFSLKGTLRQVRCAVNTETFNDYFCVRDILLNIYVHHKLNKPTVATVLSEIEVGETDLIRIHVGDDRGIGVQLLTLEKLLSSATMQDNQPNLSNALMDAGRAILSKLRSEENISEQGEDTPIIEDDIGQLDVILETLREPLRQAIEAASIMEISDSNKVKELEDNLKSLTEKYNELKHDFLNSLALFDKVVNPMTVQQLAFFLGKNMAKGITDVSSTYSYLREKEFVVMELSRGYTATTKAIGLGYCKMSNSDKPQVLITPMGLRAIANDLLKGAA